jgi:hypothetical protein
MAIGNTRRRKRKADPLTSVAAIRSVLGRLQSALPAIIPNQESDLIKLLRAVKHISRYASTDTRRGRPSPWRREDLIQVQNKLSMILLQVSQNRISISTFIDHHLRILTFPNDLLRALEAGEINLFEASHLSRIQSGRNGLSDEQAQEIRRDLLAVHVKARLSGTRLRQRVNEILGLNQNRREEKSMNLSDKEIESLEDFDPYDPSHLFWVEIKQLGFAFRNIRREDLDDALLEELLKASEPLWNVLEKIKKRQNSRPPEKWHF